VDKGKILIVAGSILQVPAVVAARELGLYVIVTDRDPDCTCAELADEFYAIDIFDVEGQTEIQTVLALSWQTNSMR